MIKKFCISTVAIILLSLCSCGSSDTPSEVWGDLVESEGDYVWDELTPIQQALVNYPTLDEASVYWVPNGHSYHAIDWCYTLDRSDTIENGSLDEAKAAGKSSPCSKCVGD